MIIDKCTVAEQSSPKSKFVHTFWFKTSTAKKENPKIICF